MRQRIRAIRQNDSGFTLIELLIVIVILGILAGVVVFAVNGIQDRGTKSACKADRKTIEVAAEAYYAQKGEYPTGIGAVGDAATVKTLIGAGLVKTPPSATSGYTIKYTQTGSGTGYTLTAKVGNNAPDTADDC